jgi:threonylcarbamoyladenosine tRNA methylthiotransferase MtaB
VNLALRKLRRQNPSSEIILTGCHKVEDFAYIEKSLLTTDFFVNLRNKKLAENGNKPLEFGNINTNKTHNSQKHTRQFLKIQDGCDNFCSYCIIPYARGVPRSVPFSEVEIELRKAVNEGFSEVVLIGINVAKYSSGGFRLVDVIEKSAEIGVKRIRLGSIEPELFTDEDLARMSKIAQICPHFHLSLQSGSDRILKLMNRKYNTAEYLGLVGNLRKYFPDCSITTDVIVGFPTETEEDFRESLEFIKAVKFHKIHIFRYSKRSGTPAEKMEQVDENVKIRRAEELRKIADILQEDFENSQKGKSFEVLFERESREDDLGKIDKNAKTPHFPPHQGRTPNNISVKIENTDGKSWQGKIRQITL